MAMIKRFLDNILTEGVLGADQVGNDSVRDALSIGREGSLHH